MHRVAVAHCPLSAPGTFEGRIAAAASMKRTVGTSVSVVPVVPAVPVVPVVPVVSAQRCRRRSQEQK